MYLAQFKLFLHPKKTKGFGNSCSSLDSWLKIKSSMLKIKNLIMCFGKSLYEEKDSLEISIVDYMIYVSEAIKKHFHNFNLQ